jgi:hypothetical protein
MLTGRVGDTDRTQPSQSPVNGWLPCCPSFKQRSSIPNSRCSSGLKNDQMHRSARLDASVFTLFTCACTASPTTGRVGGITWHCTFVRQFISREHPKPQIYDRTRQMWRDRTPSYIKSLDCSPSKRFLLMSPYVMRDQTHPSTSQVINTLSVRSQSESAPHCVELIGRVGVDGVHHKLSI